MADLIIRLVIDPQTGKKNVIIGYRSDADAMPIEHEDEHRRLVDKLIEGGALGAAELGEIIIERDQDAGQVSDETAAESDEVGVATPTPETS